MRHLSFALSSLLLLPLAAHAESFTISATVNGSTSTGILTGTSNGDGSYLITGVSGLGLPGSAPVSVVSPANSIFGADDLLFPTQARLFDVSGIELSGIFGTANLFSTVSSYEVQGIDASGDFYDAFPVSVALTSSTVTPEPSSIWLAFTGLLATGAVVFRKRLGASSQPAIL